VRTSNHIFDQAGTTVSRGQVDVGTKPSKDRTKLGTGGGNRRLIDCHTSKVDVTPKGLKSQEKRPKLVS